MMKFLRKHSRTIIIITFLSFLLTVPAYYFLGNRYGGGTARRQPSHAGLTPETKIAMVNGEQVNTSRFLWMTNQIIKMQTKFGQPINQSELLRTQYEILNELITYSLIQQEAKNKKISVSQKEVNGQMEIMKNSRTIKNNRQFNLFLKREMNITLKEYQQLIKENLVAKKVAEKIRGLTPRLKDETDSAYSRRQNDEMEKYLVNLKNQARIEILYPPLLAIDYLVKQKKDAAIGVYQKIINENPGDVYAHLFLGQLYAEQGKNDLGLIEIKKAADLNDTASEWRDPEVNVILADMYRLTGKKAEARKELDKAALIAGDSLSAHQALAAAYTQLGVPAAAEKEVQETKRIRQKMIAILKAYQNREAPTARIKNPGTKPQ